MTASRESDGLPAMGTGRLHGRERPRSRPRAQSPGGWWKPSNRHCDETRPSTGLSEQCVGYEVVFVDELTGAVPIPFGPLWTSRRVPVLNQEHAMFPYLGASIPGGRNRRNATVRSDRWRNLARRSDTVIVVGKKCQVT